MKILNIEPENYSSEARKIIEEVASYDDAILNCEELINKIPAYDVLITRLGYNINQEIMDAGANLKAIVTATTGLNHIDLDYAKEKNIKVLCLKGETNFLKTVTATAEHSFGLLLSLCRNIQPAFSDVKNHNWDRDSFKGIELYGKKLGIVGFGRLGQMMASYAHAFNMEVLATDILSKNYPDYIKETSLKDLLAQSDFISLHVSYNEKSHHLLNHENIYNIKNGAFLINTSRGEVIEEDALLSALKNQTLAGAALDVLSGENEGKKNWMKKDRLIQYAQNHNNLLLTPHLGGATKDSMSKTEIFMAEKLVKFITSFS
ncbi:MAG: hypothetical protein CL565_02445 [Alphaproteobacteria bacterium]|nr:hypothetical protein [Alphaproteobacteria bacterium]|tara:strand:+ start:754 stop:1707 length:954 start_codon:yes stop_codon:yes gene_type:complete